MTKHPAGFSMIPNSAEDDPRLDPLAFRLYAHYVRVGGHGGECWQDDDTVAAHVGICSKTVRAKRRYLEDLGYIQTERRFFNAGGSRYFVAIGEAVERQAEAPLGPVEMAAIDKAERNDVPLAERNLIPSRTESNSKPNGTSFRSAQSNKQNPLGRSLIGRSARARPPEKGIVRRFETLAG